MYLHIGGDVLINQKEIIAIIDYGNVEKSQATDEFIKLASLDGLLEKTEKQVAPKSFVITENKVYLSSISSLTLQKRTQIK